MPVIDGGEYLRKVRDNVVVAESGQPELKEEWDYEPDIDDDFLSEEEIAKRQAQLIGVSPSQFVEFSVRVPMKELQKHVPFSFEGRKYLRLPYDTPAKRTLYKCGRQVEKSTLLGNKCLTYCSVINSFNVLYVSPTNQQTKTFSQDRLKEPVETSDVLKAWTTTKLSDNVFLKKFINRSQITLRYAYHNADRCLAGDTRVHLAGGQVVKIKELFEQRSIYIGHHVVSMELDRNGVPRLTNAKLDDVVYQGRRPTYRVRVEGGAEVEMTDNEPLFTSRGWIQLKELHPGDFVAVPYQSFHGAGNAIPDEEYRLVGYLLGDGHVKEFSNVGLSNGNREVLDDFLHCAQALGAKVGGESVDPRESGTTVRINLYGGRNGYKTRLREMGLIGQTADTKRVPRDLFLGNAHQVRELLRAIWATDGWASVFQADSGLQAEIGFCSNSRVLLVDLKTLLTRFSINCVISRKKKPSTNGAQGAFTLSIRSRKHLLRFIERIGIVGKQQGLARVYDAIAGWEGKKDAFDRIAFSYSQLRSYLKQRYNLSTHSAWTKYRIQLRPGNVKDSIGREVLRGIAAKLSDEYLLTHSESDVGWARIEEITPSGEQDTYDLTVPGTENFLVDGLLVHNTRGIPADMICYDGNARVLTSNGWKHISDLKESDLVADVNDAGVIQWAHPYNIFSKRHTGEMVSFQHSQMRLRVTGDHNVWVNFHIKANSKKEDKYEFVKAIDVAKTDTMGFRMTCKVEWNEAAPEYRDFPGIENGYKENRTGITLNYKDFASLVGWYISEGHIQWCGDDCKYPRPVISQNGGRYLDEIVSVVERLGLSYRIHKDPRSDCHHVIINSGILGQYFTTLGNSYEKFIPREFLPYPELLENLLRGVYLGDACYHKGESWQNGTLRTRSKKLAEDVQEAWLRLQRPAVIHTRSMIPAHQDNPNRDIIAPVPLYEICSYNKDYFIFWRSEFESKKRIHVERVEGETVYCFTVPSHRPIVKGDFGSQPVVSGQCIDELQDIITDNIPVIEECASHSKFKLFMYAGTPKSYDNAIEHYWNAFSTQNEWVVPCDRHGTPKDQGSWHWNILGEDNIGKKGLVCDKCHELINPVRPEAQWASMNPMIKHKLKDFYEGYRIPQLMVPWLEWGEILDKQTKYPRSQFYNEVLGVSYDSGTRPLTRQDVIDNCVPGLLMSKSGLEQIKATLGQVSQVFCGIDWGCHDEETRILTERGFVYFKDLTDDDKVAQWEADSREMTFVRPQVRTIKEWNKPLHHFKGKGLDMMLTSTHRMRVGSRSGVWKTESCDKTVQRGGSLLFPGYVNWTGKEESWFVLPGQPVSPGFQGADERLFKMDDWLEFLGYYLSEGGLCFDGDRPSCLKMSQRETVNPDSTKKIGDLLGRLFPNSLSTFPNEKTGDVNWALYGKQLWKWVIDNVGSYGHTKSIPRQFLNLSKRQLRILFDAMMLGDGNTDPRTGNNNGYYCSTSKGLCEDFQELCIRLGLRSTLSLHKPAEGNRKVRWRVSWSTGRDFQYNEPNKTETVPYRGKVYCCKVPSGYIVTERNGRIAYQGNTGEGSFTILALGAYLNGFFQIFYVHRFEGQEVEPPIQLEIIYSLLQAWNVTLTGVDYGGGFDRNDALSRKFGRNRIVKYQYSQPSQKVKWEDGLNRFLVHRTEVMSDIFNAIKRRDVFRYPDWQQFEDPFGKDMLNIFSEYSEQQRQIQYKHAPDSTDDTFHAILLCFLASMLRHPRLDVLNPIAKTGISSSEDM